MNNCIKLLIKSRVLCDKNYIVKHELFESLDLALNSIKMKMKIDYFKQRELFYEQERILIFVNGEFREHLEFIVSFNHTSIKDSTINGVLKEEIEAYIKKLKRNIKLDNLLVQ